MNRSGAVNLAGFVAVAVLWGSSFPAVRLALRGFDLETIGWLEANIGPVENLRNLPTVRWNQLS